MKKRINIIPFIKPKNVGENGNEVIDYVTLSTHDELVTLPADERGKSATDFALFGGVNQSNQDRASDGLYCANEATRSIIDGRLFSSRGEKVFLSNEDDYSFGLAPTISLDLKKIEESGIDKKDIFNIKTKIYDNGKVKHIMEIGEYPKNMVSMDLSKELFEQFNGGKLKEGIVSTGRYYTQRQYSHQGVFSTKLVPEFEYNGERYILTSCTNDSIFKRLSGENTAYFRKNKDFWIKVEPITFEIKNWDELPKSINPNGKEKGEADEILLKAEQVLLSGCPLYADRANHDNLYWEDSVIRAYLNSANQAEISSITQLDSSESLSWDFTRSGFLQEAFNLSRQQMKEYVFQENEFEIKPDTFKNCVGLEKIIIDNRDNLFFHTDALSGMDKKTKIEFKLRGRHGRYIGPDDYPLKQAGYQYMYLSNDGETLTLSCQKDSELEENSIIFDLNAKMMNLLFNENYSKNYLKATALKEKGKIKFIPADFLLKDFPASEFDSFFINKNYLRWGKLIKSLEFDLLEDETQKENSLLALFEIYYAIGGFSENQGESQKAYDYILNYVVIKPTERLRNDTFIADMLHAQFSGLQLQGKYNKSFAEFFMKYYKEDPEFMSFDLDGGEFGGFNTIDYIVNAHNSWNDIIQRYPNRVVNGNDRRNLLTPRFVAECCREVIYTNVEKGNEEFALLLGKYGYSPSQFEVMQNILNQAKKIKSNAVLKAEPAEESDQVKFRILEKDDPFGFVIGNITNCCQQFGGTAESCVREGFLNPNAGFIVFEKKEYNEDGVCRDRLLGQAYVWYDQETKTVCYDNIEVPDKVINELEKTDGDITADDFINAVVKSAEAIMSKMNSMGIEVDRVTTGEGYNDLRRELDKRFEKEYCPKSKQRNSMIYTDADKAQYIIKKYDKVSNAYSNVIRETIGKAKKDIKSTINNSLDDYEL